MSSVPPMIRQGELIQQVARLVASGASGASGAWTRVRYSVNAVDPYTEELCYVTTPEGETRTQLAPRGVHDLVEELRDVMYRPGVGTWFSMELTVTRQDGAGNVDVTFNHDDMPRWDTTPASGMFAYDLRKYPRDAEHTPEWLHKLVERARNEYPEAFHIPVRGTETRFFRSYSVRVDGTRVDRALYRREREDDMTGDAVFQRDGKWHFTSDVQMSLEGYNDIDLREISEAEAAQLLEETFGDAALVHAPMVVDGQDGTRAT